MAYLVYGDLTRDAHVDQVESVPRCAPAGPAVDQPEGTRLARVDKHFGRDRVVLHVGHVESIEDGRDGTTGIGPRVKLPQGPIGRRRDEQGGVVRVRRDGIDGAFVVEPDLARPESAGMTGAAEQAGRGPGRGEFGGRIIEVVSEHGRIVATPVEMESMHISLRYVCACER